MILGNPIITPGFACTGHGDLTWEDGLLMVSSIFLIQVFPLLLHGSLQFACFIVCLHLTVGSLLHYRYPKIDTHINSGIRTWEFNPFCSQTPVGPTTKSKQDFHATAQMIQRNHLTTNWLWCLSVFLPVLQEKGRQLRYVLGSSASGRRWRSQGDIPTSWVHTCVHMHIHCPYRHSLGSHRLWTSHLLCPPFLTDRSHWSLFWTPRLDCSTRGFQARKNKNVNLEIVSLTWSGDLAPQILGGACLSK